MGKLLAIIKREYLTRVKSKGFIIGTVLTPLLVTVVLLLPALLIGKEWRTNYRLMVLDQTKDLALYENAEKYLVAEIERFNERGEGEDRSKIAMAYGLVGLLCLSVLIYGTHILSAVIEEKQSRIVEVLLSSVRPLPLMLGKLVGVGVVGLTQYVVWAVCAVLLSGPAIARLLAFGSFKPPHISVSLMIYFVTYFLLGYFLYATLYVIAGAIVSNEEDGEQMQFPLMLLIILAPTATIFVWRSPDSAAAVIISLIPFFNPTAMFFRIAVQSPPWWQITLSIVLMIATILGAIWLAAKFYRVGVLMYGKRPTLPELAKWLTYS